MEMNMRKKIVLNEPIAAESQCGCDHGDHAHAHGHEAGDETGGCCGGAEAKASRRPEHPHHEEKHGADTNKATSGA